MLVEQNYEWNTCVSQIGSFPLIWMNIRKMFETTSRMILDTMIFFQWFTMKDLTGGDEIF